MGLGPCAKMCPLPVPCCQGNSCCQGRGEITYQLFQQITEQRHVERINSFASILSKNTEICAILSVISLHHHYSFFCFFLTFYYRKYLTGTKVENILTFHRFIIQVHIFFPVFFFSTRLPFFFFPSPYISSMASSSSPNPSTPPKSLHCCPCPWVLSSFFFLFLLHLYTPTPPTDKYQMISLIYGI